MEKVKNAARHCKMKTAPIWTSLLRRMGKFMVDSELLVVEGAGGGPVEAMDLGFVLLVLCFVLCVDRWMCVV